MRIALVGANGQLGRDLGLELPDATRLERPRFDVTHASAVEETLVELRPQVVLNCAALTHVDQCEREPEAAFRVNAIGAGNVARACELIGAALVYISTDYVFGAQRSRALPYSELEVVGPVNAYGSSKLAGEHMSQAHCSRCFVVRSSGLYGTAGARGKGGNFVETMLRLAAEGKSIRVVDDQRLSPTSTRQLARRIVALVKSGAYGLYHVGAADHCTWFEFAQEIFATQRLAVEVAPIPTSEYPLPARRPAMSALASVRLAAAGVAGCPSWRDMLHEYLGERKAA